MIEFILNGKTVRTDDDPTTPLLWVVRDTFKLKGSKFGCGAGLCGACTMHIDGTAARTCTMPISGVDGREVTTIEGLGTPANPHPLQLAFIEEQALQCGYCTNGMIITAAELLIKNPAPGTADIKKALAGHQCRCGAHPRIVKAVKRAAGAKS